MSTRRQRASLASANRATAGTEVKIESSAAVPSSSTAGQKRKSSAVAVKEEEDTTAADETPAVDSKKKKNRRAAKKAKLALARGDTEAAAVHQATASSSSSSNHTSSGTTSSSTSLPLTNIHDSQRDHLLSLKDDEERELEAFLFGGAEGLGEEEMMEDGDEGMKEEGGMKKGKKQQQQHMDTSDMFQIDTVGANGASHEDDDTAADEDTNAKKKNSTDPTAIPSWLKSSLKADGSSSSSSKMIDLSSAPRLRKLKAHAEERFITREEYTRRLRALYREMHPDTEWNMVPTASTEGGQNGEIDIMALLQQSSGTKGVTASKLAGGAGRGEKLSQGTIELIRMADANLTAPSQAVVCSTRFHANGQLMLTAGLDKMVRLFSIDGIENTKVQGVWLEDMPVYTAEWLYQPQSQSNSISAEIIASGRRKHFYSIDVATNAVTKIAGIKGREEKSLERFIVAPNGEYIVFLGNDGYLLVVSARSKQFIGSMKMNVSVRSAAFSDDSTLLFSYGGEGLVYIWDMSTRKCLYKHIDEGSIHGTTIGVAASEKGYYACGSESGVVNLYNTKQLTELAATPVVTHSSSSSSSRLLSTLNRPSPTPLKSFMNLVNPIDSIVFNYDASLMMIASRRAKDCLKLIHVESQTVYQNWPTSSTPLHFVTTVDFSPNSGYLTIGNDRGRVLLYRITHYPKA